MFPFQSLPHVPVSPYEGIPDSHSEFSIFWTSPYSMALIFLITDFQSLSQLKHI